MRALGVVLLLAPALALAQTRPLELLPADEWLRPARRAVLVATAKPLAGMDSIESWAELTMRVPGHAHLRARLLRLEAGPVGVDRISADLHARLAWFEVRAGGSARRIRIEELGAQNYATCSGAVVIAHGSVRGGLRAVPWSSEPGRRVEWEQALHLSRRGSVLALERSSNRYGGRALWSLGLGVRLHESFTLALRTRDEEILLQLEARRSELGIRLGLPLASPHGGGVAVGVGWFP